ncbi:MAG: hypothetical protein OXC83_00215, partial [Chloroflexi bacterium]|nr:hypothetical protein [Chloroflexota bacterium]
MKLTETVSTPRRLLKVAMPVTPPPISNLCSNYLLFLRLSPLLALALLLGALSLFPAASAQAQSPAVWTATLTVDRDDVYFGCHDTFPSQDNCSISTVLTENEFRHG